jgi:hypothetical protein
MALSFVALSFRNGGKQQSISRAVVRKGDGQAVSAEGSRPMWPAIRRLRPVSFLGDSSLQCFIPLVDFVPMAAWLSGTMRTHRWTVQRIIALHRKVGR